MAIVNRWTFYDPINLTTYTFEVNPDEGGSPTMAKTVTYQNTAAPDGKTLVFEGRDQPPMIRFSGKILTEDQYDAMMEWFSKRHQIEMTDDLERSYWVYITSFNPTRIRARSHPWKHSYEVEATIVDWPS